MSQEKLVKVSMLNEQSQLLLNPEDITMAATQHAQTAM